MIRQVFPTALLAMAHFCAWGALEGITVAGNLASEEPAVSADGRMVAFSSKATNFEPGDNNAAQDIFVFDRENSTFVRVSVDALGNEANGLSGAPRLSADGMLVAFSSLASNLAGGDSGMLADVFVKDLADGSIELISAGLGGLPGDGDSIANDFSADGRYVVFESTATNLTADPVPAGVNQIYLHDRQTGMTELVSLATGGAIADDDSFVPVVSTDGRLVAFESLATNLGTNTPGKRQIFVRDRTNDTTQPVCLDDMDNAASDDCFDPEFANGGTEVFFYTASSNLAGWALTQIYIRDLSLGVTTILPITGQISIASEPDVSADGRNVVFLSPTAPGFFENVGLYERGISRLSEISRGPGGVPANNDSGEPVISSDGRIIAFPSEASNLVPGDGNTEEDVFVRDLNLIFVSGFEGP